MNDSGRQNAPETLSRDGTGQAPSFGRIRACAYASGSLGKNLVWTGAELTLLFLLTELMRFDATTAASIIFISLIANVILDPVVGLASDRLTGPFGSKAPFILMGGPLCGFSFAALYSLPALGWVTPCSVMTLLIMFRAGFSLMDAPHNALLAVAAKSDSNRTFLSAGRYLFGSLGAFAIIAFVPALTASGSPAREIDIAQCGIFAGALSAVVMIGAAYAARSSEERTNRWHIDFTLRRVNAKLEFLAPIAIVTMVTMILYAGAPMYGKLIVYHATFHDKGSPSATMMFWALMIGQVAGVALWTVLAARMSLRTGLMATCWCIAATGLSAMFMTSMHGRTDLIISFVFGAFTSGIYIFIWVLVADCADRVPRVGGITGSTLIFSAIIVGLKLGQGLGTLIGGWGLSLSGYYPGIQNSERLAVAIPMMQAAIPLVASLLAAALLILYPWGSSSSNCSSTRSK